MLTYINLLSYFHIPINDIYPYSIILGYHLYSQYSNMIQVINLLHHFHNIHLNHFPLLSPNLQYHYHTFVIIHPHCQQQHPSYLLTNNCQFVPLTIHFLFDHHSLLHFHLLFLMLLIHHHLHHPHHHYQYHQLYQAFMQVVSSTIQYHFLHPLHHLPLVFLSISYQTKEQLVLQYQSLQNHLFTFLKAL